MDSNAFPTGRRLKGHEVEIEHRIERGPEALR